VGEPVVVRTERQAELNRGFFDIDAGLRASSPKLPPLPPELPPRLSARWTGSLRAPLTGEYLLSLTSLGSARLLLDGQVQLANTPSAPVAPEAATPAFGSPIGTAASAIQVSTTAVRLTAGERYAVAVEYAADAPEQSFFKEAMLRFGWQPPADVVTPMVAEAVELARQADVAVVVARTFESEAMDRPHLRLPGGQDELIRAVKAANPRTVVVLMSATPVETASWEQGVPAVLEAWYAGQEQGDAVARVLIGDVTPSGKLPLTFPRADDQTPLSTPEQYPGVGGAVHYTEGVLVGYRGYDALGIAPQYPFGYGLSYTTFAYSDLSVTPRACDGAQPLAVQFAVENTGDRAGIEIAQVYLGLPYAAGEPPRRLAGWARVRLEPGERRVVAVIVDPQAPGRPLSTWDTTSGGWTAAHGEATVFVGASSRDLRLHAPVTIG
jgi:beta-glucosidase